MSQLDAPYPEYEEPYDEPHFEDEPTTSRLAIASLVSSLIICCPITTAIGPLLGVIALVRIGSNPMKRGTGIALAAILIGVIATALWVWLAIFSYQTFAVPTQEGPREAFRAGFDGNPDRFRDQMFGATAQASDDDVEAFIEELRTRYGNFVTSRLDEQELAARPMDPADVWDPVRPHPYILEFEDATVKADIDVTPVDPDTGAFTGIRFGNIVIHDENLGDLHFPPRPNADG